MLKNLMPDRVFDSFRDITPEMLDEMGIKALLLDIDNTLVTYDDLEPTPDADAWLCAMRDHGIKIAFVSNNSSPDRVNVFNKNYGFYATGRSKKPLTVGFKRAMRALEVKPEECLSIGDQIFTDVWGAKNSGAHAFFVPPINDRTDLFFRFKRLLEKPIMRKYWRSSAATCKKHAETDK